jgi:hypothetical protein
MVEKLRHKASTKNRSKNSKALFIKKNAKALFKKKSSKSPILKENLKSFRQQEKLEKLFSTRKAQKASKPLLNLPHSSKTNKFSSNLPHHHHFQLYKTPNVFPPLVFLFQINSTQTLKHNFTQFSPKLYYTKTLSSKAQSFNQNFKHKPSSETFFLPPKTPKNFPPSCSERLSFNLNASFLSTVVQNENAHKTTCEK